MHIEKQRRQKPNLQDKKLNMAVSDDFLNELLKYDFTSTKKGGRAVSSILI